MIRPEGTREVDFSKRLLCPKTATEFSGKTGCEIAVKTATIPKDGGSGLP
jgi:hypothetical protein